MARTNRHRQLTALSSRRRLLIETLEGRRLLAVSPPILLTVNSSGTEAVGFDSPGLTRTMSGDGRYLVLESNSGDLVAGDNNGTTDVFLRDLQTGSITLVSRTSSNTSGNNYSGSPMLSVDGSFVVFASYATDLNVSGINSTTGVAQIYRYSRATGQIDLVSANADKSDGGNNHSWYPSVSADGSRVAYVSLADDLVSGMTDQNGGNDIFYTQFSARTNHLVSHLPGDPLTTSAGSSTGPVTISRDGSTILYESSASDLQTGVSDINGVTSDLVSYSIASSSNQYVTVAFTGEAAGNGGTFNNKHSLSADGRYQVFMSNASDLIPNDRNTVNDVFLRDNLTGEITLISRSAEGAAADAGADYAAISGDGAFVVFTSWASNLDVTGVDAYNGSRQVYRWTRADGTIEAISLEASGSTGAWGDNAYPVLNFDGSKVAFASTAADLVAGMINNDWGYYDLFVRDMASGTTSLISYAAGTPDTAANGTIDEDSILFSRDGNVLLYGTSASNMESGVSDTLSSSYDLVRFDFNAVADKNRYVTLQAPTAASGNSVSNFSDAQAGSMPEQNVSADGLYTVFESSASDLVPNDFNGHIDVFLRNNSSGEVTLISRSVAGQSADSVSSQPAISADGEYVVFYSWASNLDVTGLNAYQGWTHQVYRWERATGEIVSVSLNAAGDAGGSGYSSSASISGDGSRIAFLSTASDLVADQVDNNGWWDIFVRDMTSGVTSLVSHIEGDLLTTSSTATAYGSLISRDGSRIVYPSDAEEITTIPNSGFTDLFSYEVSSGLNTLVNLNQSGTAASDQGISASLNFAISNDGRFIAYESSSTDIDPLAMTGDWDIYLRDLDSSQSIVVSVDTNRTQKGNSSSVSPAISGDGRYIAFTSWATNLVTNDTNSRRDGFVYDRINQTTTMVSVAANGDQSSEDSLLVLISNDGSQVAFTSAGYNLDPSVNDNNGATDVFYRDWLSPSPTTTLVSRDTSGSASANSGSSLGGISDDGSLVVFSSSATDLVPITDANGSLADLFAYSGGNTSLISRRDLSVRFTLTAGYNPESVSMDDTGRWIAFESSSFGAVDLPSSGIGSEVYVHDTSTRLNEIVSIDSDDARANAGSATPTISGDGRYVAFLSWATNLVGDDFNNRVDAFVRDRQLGETRRVSLGSDGSEVDYNVDSVDISHDGTQVVLVSRATTLEPSIPNPNIVQNVFLRNWQDDIPLTRQLSVDLSGDNSGDSSAYFPLLSDDGEFVVFQSEARNLGSIPNANGYGIDLFWWDGTTTDFVATKDTSIRYTMNTGITGPYDQSDDGRWVTFTTAATGIDHYGQSPGYYNVFVFDAQTQSNERISVGPLGELADWNSNNPTISGDGRYIAFQSDATNIISPPANNPSVYLHDQQTGLATLVSVGPGGVEADGPSYGPTISRDGSTVAFQSWASNLSGTVSDTNGAPDIFLRKWNVTSPITDLVSRNHAGATSSNGYSSSPQLSENGTTVVFESYSDDLTTISDTNGLLDLFAVKAASLSLSAASANKLEGDSGTLNYSFTVSRSWFTAGTASLKYLVQGSGTNPATANDFVGGNFPSGTVNFSAGQTSRTINIPVLGDKDVELDESFSVIIYDPTQNAQIINNTALGTILNNDIDLSIAATSAVKPEGDSGNTPFTFTVTRTGYTGIETTVNYAVTGTANAADFGGTLPSGAVTFPVGSTSQVITINASGDLNVEANEDFTVTLSSPSGNAEINTATAIGTIQNDDIDLSIAATSAVKPEGDSGNTPFTFTVTRTGYTGIETTVNYAVTGTANAADFGGTLPSGAVTFPIGSTSQVITINASGDLNVEANEDFTVTLSSPSGNAEINTATANGTIQNDDAATVATVIIGDGTIQRSLVNQVEVVFDGYVEIETGAFTVERRGVGGGLVDVVAAAPVFDGNQTRVLLTFQGTFVRGSWNALVDGNYQLTIDASKIRSGSIFLDGDNDGNAGGNYVIGDEAADKFFALYADISGDRTVTLAEFNAFRSSFGTSTGSTNYNPLFDYLGAGSITLADFNRFRSRFGTTLGF